MGARLCDTRCARWVWSPRAAPTHFSGYPGLSQGPVEAQGEAGRVTLPAPDRELGTQATERGWPGAAGTAAHVVHEETGSALSPQGRDVPTTWTSEECVLAKSRGAKAAGGHPASRLSDSAQWQLRPPHLHPQSHETARPRDNVSGKSYTATHKARRTPAWPEDMFPSGDSPDPLPDRAPSSPISARPTITWREGTRPVSHAHPASSSLPM